MIQKYDELTAFLSGIAGSLLAINLAGITWETAWANLGNLLWLGFIAMFSGAMGVLGKHLINKLMRRKSKNKNL